MSGNVGLELIKTALSAGFYNKLGYAEQIPRGLSMIPGSRRVP